MDTEMIQTKRKDSFIGISGSASKHQEKSIFMNLKAIKSILSIGIKPELNFNLHLQKHVYQIKILSFLFQHRTLSYQVLSLEELMLVQQLFYLSSLNFVNYLSMMPTKLLSRIKLSRPIFRMQKDSLSSFLIEVDQ